MIFSTGFAWSQQSDRTGSNPTPNTGQNSNMDRAGRDTKNAAKHAGRATKNGAKKAWKKTKHGTKKAWKKTKHTTKGAYNGAKRGAEEPQ